MVMALVFTAAATVVPTRVSATIPTPIPSVTSVPTIAPPVPNTGKKQEYILPYPGLLSDHPLYFLKTLRDAILDRLIVDPLRRAEFYLLQADKRLSMGLFLQEKGKGALAGAAVGEGEIFMEKMVTSLGSFRETGKDVPRSIVDRVNRALEKHTEVIVGMAGKADGQEKQKLLVSLELVKKLEGEVGKLP